MKRLLNAILRLGRGPPVAATVAGPRYRETIFFGLLGDTERRTIAGLLPGRRGDIQTMVEIMSNHQRGPRTSERPLVFVHYARIYVAMFPRRVSRELLTKTNTECAKLRGCVWDGSEALGTGTKSRRVDESRFTGSHRL